MSADVLKQINKISTMSLFSIFGGGNAPAYPTDTIVAPDGTEVTFTFFKNAC